MTSLLRFPIHPDDTQVHPTEGDGESTGESRAVPIQRAALRLVDSSFTESRQRREMSVDILYPQTETSSSDISSALRLLSEAITHAEKAVSCEDEQDIMGADDAITHIEIMMPELFCCRSLGDSYGLIIASVMSSLANRRGEPLTTIQVRTLWLALKALRQEPFMTYEKALDVVDSLEEVNMNIEPQGFEGLVGWIVNE